LAQALGFPTIRLRSAMKYLQQMNTILVGLLLTGAAGQTYGPNGCVLISKSQQGTCVIRTNCGEGVNLDALEFAFDCGTAAAVQKHSFGVGGFDLVEEFDTDIKCSQCSVPEKRKIHKAAKKSPVHLDKSSVHMLAGQSATKGDDLVDKYGPGKCVETYRGTTGTCMVRTQCKDQDISNYEFGMLCVHDVKTGENVRHLFGKKSFDPEEEFDTLIKCEQCLGLKEEAAGDEAAPAAPAVVAGAKTEDIVKKVNSLVDEVGEMQSGLEKIKSDVKILNEKVPKLYSGDAKKDDATKKDGDEAKEGDAKDEAAEDGATDEAKEGDAKDEAKEGDAKDEAKDEEKKPELFLAHHRAARHSHKKHHHKQRRSSDDDDDDDDDSKADKDDDEGTDDSTSSKKSSGDQDEEQDDSTSSKKSSKDQDEKQDEDDSGNDKQGDDDGKHSEDAN